MLKKFLMLSAFALAMLPTRTMQEIKTAHAAKQAQPKALTMQEITAETLKSPHKAELLAIFNAISSCTSKNTLLPKLQAAIQQHYADLEQEKAKAFADKQQSLYTQAAENFKKAEGEDACNYVDRIIKSLRHINKIPQFKLSAHHAHFPLKFFMDQLIDIINNGSRLTAWGCHHTGYGSLGYDFKNCIYYDDTPEKTFWRTLESFDITVFRKDYTGAYGAHGHMQWQKLVNDAFEYRRAQEKNPDTSWREPLIYCYEQVYAQYTKYYAATGELPAEQYAPEIVFASFKKTVALPEKKL